MSVDSVLGVGPRMLGRYELLAPIARGGMGQVWVGRLCGARGFNKLVAIKTLLSTPDAEGRLERMLFEEARIAALIHHANVVQTLELGEHDGQLYLVMEWVDGESLNFIMQRAEARGGVPLPIAVHWIAQTLLGLHAAHELTDGNGSPLGVVHRDASPHNVLITHAGVAKLADFGIAKAMNESATFSGEVKGKLSYIAPEQLLCEGIDRRADIFAIGIVLYLLTTGQHPFKGTNSLAALQGISSDDPAPPPSQCKIEYPALLEEVVLKALEKNAEHRFRTAEEMYRALQRAVPQAFELGFERVIRDYLVDLVEDRAVLRRETLRRAQLEADSRAASQPAANQAPGRSWTSLRAVSLDETPAKDSSCAPEQSTPVAPVQRTRGRLVLLTAVGSLIGVIGVAVALRGTSLNPRVSAAPPAAPAVTSLRASASGRDKDAPDGRSNAEQDPTGAQSAPATGVPGTSTSGVISPGHSPTSTSTRPEGRKARRSSRSADLIKPDYAR